MTKQSDPPGVIAMETPSPLCAGLTDTRAVQSVSNYDENHQVAHS